MGPRIKLMVKRLGPDDAPIAEYDFDQDHVSIGRADRNDIALADPEKRVSNRHARIDRSGGGFYLVDLASTNGTMVDGVGARPQERVELQSGVLLELGAFEISVEIVAAAEDEGEPPAGAGDRPAQHAETASPPAIGEAACGGGPAGSGAGLDGPVRAMIERLASRFLEAEQPRSEEEIARFLERVEHALAASFDWILKCLLGRSEFKGRFSADVTMMFELGGNPIKEATSPEEIGRFVLGFSDRRKVEEIRSSLDDAYRDLTLHQLGLLAGVQDCMKTVLQRLAPQAIEERIGGQAKGWGSAKRLWAEFVKVHEELFEDTSRLFSEVIYPSMRKGYLTAHSVLESGGGAEQVGAKDEADV